MENERIAENEINLLDMFYILRKNLISIIVSAVVVAVVFLVYTITMMTPVYRSTTQLLVRGISQEAMTIYPDSSSRIMLMNNSIEVLNGTQVMYDVIDELSLEITPEQLQSMIDISCPVDTQVLKISVLSTDPSLARDIAVTLAELAHGALAENVGIAALSVIQEAKTPVAPVSPNPVKNTILGGFLGAFLAIAVAIIMWFVRNKIHTPSDVERSLGLIVFSSIPLVESEENEGNDKNTKDKKRRKK